VTRREFAAVSGSALAAVVLGPGCALEMPSPDVSRAKLTARPNANGRTTAPGTRPLNLGESRDALLHIPETTTSGPLPFLLLLHGASSSGGRLLERLRPAVDASGAVVLAPDSRGSTWDALRTTFGRDVAFLDRALEQVFDLIGVDAERTAIGGFSDGATYALSLGLINGDLFRKIVAFSPGFLIDGPPAGQPHVFVSHGTADDILPIDRCSRVIVPDLKRRGRDVTFREFEGGHEVPEEIAIDALKWAAKRD